MDIGKSLSMKKGKIWNNSKKQKGKRWKSKKDKNKSKYIIL